MQYELEVYSKRVENGRLRWGATSYNGVVDLVVMILGTMDAKYYCGALETYYLSIKEGILEQDEILQQNDDLVPTDNYTMERLQDSEVTVMDWPAT